MTINDLAQRKNSKSAPNFRLTVGHDERSQAWANKVVDAIHKSKKSKTDFVFDAIENACDSKSLAGASITFDNEPLDDYDGKTEAELVAVVLENMSIEALAKKCISTYAKRIHQQNSKTTRTGHDRKRKTSSDVQERLHALVVERMAANDKATGWHEKRAINSSWLQKGGNEDSMGRTTGIKNIYSFKAITEYLSVHGDEIEAHHAKHGIKGNYNQRVSNELKRLAKG